MMLNFLASTLIAALGVTAFLNWGSRQAEHQIDQMQAAAFNTPGTVAPIPPQVVAGGLGLLLGHFVAARLLGVRGGQAILSLLLGSAVGAVLVVGRAQGTLR